MLQPMKMRKEGRKMITWITAERGQKEHWVFKKLICSTDVCFSRSYMCLHRCLVLLEGERRQRGENKTEVGLETDHMGIHRPGGSKGFIVSNREAGMIHKGVKSSDLGGRKINFSFWVKTRLAETK